MIVEPDFITVDDVMDIHTQQLERYGGSPGVRDPKLLESAVMTPQASFGGRYVHEDLFSMAAAYAFHIAENQPFIDGNKRTALAAALVFLEFNGFEVSDPDGELYQAMIKISSKTLDKAGLAKLFSRLMQSSTA